MNNNYNNFQVQAHAITDKGRRLNNEDFVTSFEPTDPQERLGSGCIYIVADGVGGASVGERASQYAAEKVLYEYYQHPEIEPGTRLKQVITNVNQEIFQYSIEKGIRMATTITVAVVLNNSLLVANVGDSRAYLIRRQEVRQITRDHNIVGELVRDGSMTEEEAIRSKAKNRLTRSIGGEEEVHVDIFGPVPLQPGDKVVLCSDGLTRYALREDIASMATSGSPEQISNTLMAFAKERGRGGADNISVITIAYEPHVELATTVQQPRPVAPEQPWELAETDHEPKAPAAKPGVPSRRKWIALAATGLMGIVVVGGVVFIFAMWPGILPLIGITSPTPTIIITPSPGFTPIFPLTTSPAITDTPSPTATELTPTAFTVMSTIKCETNFNPKNVRSNPSEESEGKGTIACGETVKVIGIHFTNDPEISAYNWYRIDFEIEGEIKPVWVAAFLVDVSHDDIGNLPLLDFNGTPVTPTLTFTPKPDQLQESQQNLVNCNYTAQANENLSIISQKFGITDLNNITCKLDSLGCDISDPNNIEQGWQLVIKGVTNDVCTANNGVVSAE